MKTSLMVGALVAIVQSVFGLDVIEYKSFDDGGATGEDLMPYVYDRHFETLLKEGNAGFGRLTEGKYSYMSLDSAVATAGEELTIEFFIKGGPDGIGTTWHPLFALGGAWPGAPRGVSVDATDSKGIYVKVATEAQGIDAIKVDTGVSLIDGRWHHVAVTVQPIDGGSHVCIYVDYVCRMDVNTTSPYRYAGTACLELNRVAGQSYGMEGGTDIDELKFTRGIVPVEDFMRLSDAGPDDVKTLAYVDFGENARMTVESDTLPYVYSLDCTQMIRDDNVRFYRLGKGSSVYEKLKDPYGDITQANRPLTVEFFIKAGPEGIDATWKTLFALGGAWSNASSFNVEVDDAKNIYLRPYVGNPRKAAFATGAGVSLVDGRWHHVAMTVEPIDGGAGSCISVYADYGLVNRVNTSSPYLYAMSDLCYEVNKTGNSANVDNSVEIDELRISRGVVAQADFLRKADREVEPIEEGDAMLYLPFDGDCETLVRKDGQGAITGVAVYQDATKTRAKVLEHGSQVVVRTLNEKYLGGTEGDLEIEENLWELTANGSETCTVEFFVRGGSDVGVWEKLLCYGKGTGLGQYGFMAYANEIGSIWFKPGAGSADIGVILPVNMKSSKWHHVAMQVSPSEVHSGGSHFDFYVDYEPVETASVDSERAWNGLTGGKILIAPGNIQHGGIDELRVTRGLLPPEKFLSFEKIETGLLFLLK